MWLMHPQKWEANVIWLTNQSEPLVDDISRICLIQTVNDLSTQPGFPIDYCNIASKYLLNLLKNAWKTNVRLQHSYLEDWDWHTYVVETLKNWQDIILDPTYSQYDDNEEYKKWFIWFKFPNKILERNRTEQEDFLKKQREWFSLGIYDILNKR